MMSNNKLTNHTLSRTLSNWWMLQGECPGKVSSPLCVQTGHGTRHHFTGIIRTFGITNHQYQTSLKW